MIDPWLPVLNGLPLSRTEREVVKRFEQDPLGRIFLPVADILRSHRLVDESLELLTQGVERHPAYVVARVVLVRELLQKGMAGEAWRALEDSPLPLRDNLLAQKLRFKLALLLRLEHVVKATYHHLKLHQMLDPETRQLGELMEVSGVETARESLVRDFRNRGIDLQVPAESPVGYTDAGLARAGGVQVDDGVSQSVSEYFDCGPLEENADIAGFHVVPLSEIFRPDDRAGGRPEGGSLELDSTTLADIYARQGHYSKALEVYRRLLRLTPGNDLLKRKVADLARLEKEQRQADLTVDPVLVDKMETVEIIDRQIRFYNDLLAKLT